MKMEQENQTEIQGPFLPTPPEPGVYWLKWRDREWQESGAVWTDQWDVARVLKDGTLECFATDEIVHFYSRGSFVVEVGPKLEPPESDK